MKRKWLWLLAVAVLTGDFIETSKAVSLIDGPVFFRLWGYEVKTVYAGGLTGKLYFRDASTSYYTEEYGQVTYDAGNPDHRLFTGNANPADDLIISKDASLEAGEDAFGLLRISEIRRGDITSTDSRFGDGNDTTPEGNEFLPIIGPAQWNEGDVEGGKEKYLRGMFWGVQNQVIEVVASGMYRIWSSSGQFDIFEINDNAGYDPTTKQPGIRADTDDFDVVWFDRNANRLVWGGSIEYHRYEGDLAYQMIDGNTEILLNFTRGDWAVYMQDWWTNPDSNPAHIWQTWNNGDPFVFNNGWFGSEDISRGVCKESCEYVLKGDLNDDCIVDLVDFAIMARNWLVDCFVDPSDPACEPKS